MQSFRTELENPIVEKDITQRHQINDKRAFENIVKFIQINNPIP